MKRNLLLLIPLLALATPVQAQITIPHTFVAGTVANPDDVNTNFSQLGSQALNRTGGTLTGNLSVDSGITIDGIDIGAVLGGTGTPTFSTITTTGTATIGGNASVTGTLGVTGATTLSSTLTVTGNTTLGALLDVDGFGTHTFSAGGSGANILHVRNTTAGTANSAYLELGNDATAMLGLLQAHSSTYTSNTINNANAILLRSLGAGGLDIAASNASGAIRFYAGGTAEQLRLHASGGLSLGSTTDPGAGSLRVADDVIISDALTVGGAMAVTGATTLTSTSVTGSLTVSGTSPMTFPTTSSAVLVCDNVTENSMSEGSTKVVRFTTAGSAVCLVNGNTPATDGRMMLLVNATGQQITLLHEDASVTASARFSLPGGTNANFFANEVLLIWYDGTSLRWRTAARP